MLRKLQKNVGYQLRSALNRVLKKTPAHQTNLMSSQSYSMTSANKQAEKRGEKIQDSSFCNHYPSTVNTIWVQTVNTAANYKLGPYRVASLTELNESRRNFFDELAEAALCSGKTYIAKEPLKSTARPISQSCIFSNRVQTQILFWNQLYPHRGEVATSILTFGACDQWIRNIWRPKKSCCWTFVTEIRKSQYILALWTSLPPTYWSGLLQKSLCVGHHFFFTKCQAQQIGFYWH